MPQTPRLLPEAKYSPDQLRDDLGRFASGAGVIASGAARRLVSGLGDFTPLEGEGDIIPDPADLDRRLVDYKPDRSLSDPGKTEKIENTLDNARFLAYSQMPFLAELHIVMGVESPEEIAIEDYVQKRNDFFTQLPLSQVPLDSLVVTQENITLTNVCKNSTHII